MEIESKTRRIPPKQTVAVRHTSREPLDNVGKTQLCARGYLYICRRYRLMMYFCTLLTNPRREMCVCVCVWLTPPVASDESPRVMCTVDRPSPPKINNTGKNGTARAARGSSWTAGNELFRSRREKRDRFSVRH